MRFRSLALLVVLIATTILAAIDFRALAQPVLAQSGYPPPEPPAAATSGPLNNHLFLPLVRKAIPVPATSYYVTNVGTLASLGTAIGSEDSAATSAGRNRLVILHFGYPASSGSNYGVKLSFSPTVFVPMVDVTNAVVAFAQNWYTNSASNTTAHLRIVLGVVNCCQSTNPNSDLALMQNHGTAWANAIQTIRTQTVGTISSRVDVVAGYDMEYDWNRPYASTQWVNKFAAQGPAGCNTGSTGYDQGCIYNYGTMAVSVSGTTCATSVTTTTWVACDVWYASWGATKSGVRVARALPQIYLPYDPSRPQYPWGVNATQWKDLSLFSANQMSAGPITFVGVLTQRARCGDGCTQGNNTPETGYWLLLNALASNTTTKQTPRWSTDISLQP